MKHNKRRITASVLTLIVLTLIVLAPLVGGVSAAFVSISLDQRAVSENGNWVWSGTATTTSPHHYVCIEFPGTSVSPVRCSGSISGLGSRPFTCTVPASTFSGVTGNASWRIFANNHTNCQGPQSANPPGSATTYSGTFIPTAVSLSDFQAGPLGQAGVWLLLPLIALLLGAAYMVVFKVLKAAPRRSG